MIPTRTFGDDEGANALATSTQKWWRPYDGMDVQRFDATGAAQTGDVSWNFSGV